MGGVVRCSFLCHRNRMKDIFFQCMQNRRQLRSVSGIWSKGTKISLPAWIFFFFSKQQKTWNTHVAQQQNVLEKKLFIQAPEWNECAACCSSEVCSKWMKQNDMLRFGNKCSLENFSIKLPGKKKKKSSLLNCTILEIMLLNEILCIAEA